MLFSRLKLQIAGTLLVLLTVAVLLSCVVIMAFWQKAALRTELEHARAVWTAALSAKSSGQPPSRFETSDELKLLCSATGNRCAGVVLSGGEHWLQTDIPDLRAKSLLLAKEAGASQREIIRIEGNPWGILSLKKKYLLIAEPLPSGVGEEPRAAVVIIALDSIYAAIFENRHALFVYLLVNVILLTVVGFFRLITLTVKPIERMVGMSTSYQDPDVLFFSGEQHRSEFGQLSMALNGMFYRIEADRVKLRRTVSSLETAHAELLQTQKEMVRTEKMVSVGRLSAGLAHEIGNPIGIVQGYIELLQQPDLDQADKQQFAQRALSELERVNKLIRQLLDYAGSSAHERSRVQLDQLFAGICQIVPLKKYSPPISVLRDIPADICIECDGESLRQVFLNCLFNALDAIEAKTGDYDRQIIITAEKVVEAEGGQATIHIKMTDNGLGIKEKDLDAIFDPFFTTKAHGKGTGLGLFVSHSIIDAHGGKIWLESIFGQGSTVHIQLPIFGAADQGK